MREERERKERGKRVEREWKEVGKKYFFDDYCSNTCVCQKKVVILQAKLRGGYYDRFTTERRNLS